MKSVILKLILNGIRFRIRKFLKKPLFPWALTVAVTGRCNSRCVMCNIWRLSQQIPNLKEIELKKDEIKRLLSNPLLSSLVELDITGGEPFLRDDLVELVEVVKEVKEKNLKRLKTIAIATNGFLTQKILRDVKSILEILKGSGIDLVMVCSLDGVGKLHEKIRRRRGAFERLLSTLDGLLELKSSYEDFWVGTKTTVSRLNIQGLEEIKTFGKQKGIFFQIISPVIFTPVRYRNLERQNELDPFPEFEKLLLDFYRKENFFYDYYAFFIIKLLKEGRRPPCTAMFNYLYIDYDGSCYPCPLLENKIGNIRNSSIEQIWRNATKIREKISKLPLCTSCTEPGLLRFTLPLEGFWFARFLIKRRCLQKTFYSNGFHKYLT
ncbi:MAG TPA: radical SAM protein [Candidatus Aerophobetes bacterium]|uniref:Radical SAM protein n=1 Tax=Aerophobetes bacterium TaxID=2030807 RepID=A0A7V0QTF1_UNCAE|nr:radical SAM protein [Candidatus Aerophobetes bacterium]